MLKPGDKIALVACSNGLPLSEKEKLDTLSERLISCGLVPVWSDHIYQTHSVFSATAKERAQALMKFYGDADIKGIFDLSGGDLANGLLEFLDYDFIQKHPKPFWGYSDLTTVINALYTKTGAVSCLYQLKNLVRDTSGNQLADFRRTVLEGYDDLYGIHWQPVQGSQMEGTVIGGNVRCFLKLAGTPYLPEFENKLLFLESYGGGAAQMTTYFYQLRQLGAFEKINGLLLGTFTKMEEQQETPTAVELALQIIDNPRLPVAKTQQVGHQRTSKCLMIGAKYKLVF